VNAKPSTKRCLAVHEALPGDGDWRGELPAPSNLAGGHANGALLASVTNIVATSALLGGNQAADAGPGAGSLLEDDSRALALLAESPAGQGGHRHGTRLGRLWRRLKARTWVESEHRAGSGRIRKQMVL
jgi:hypothetical protein